MARRLWVGLLVAFLLFLAGGDPAARQLPPGYVDPQPLLAAARKAIGTDSLQCVTMSGVGYAGMVGQQRLNDKNVDWPRGEPLANYTRTMNWQAGTMKEEFDRKPGLNPASWKYGLGWVDGTPSQKQPHQAFLANGKYAWHVDGTGGTPVALSPEDAERAQVELWLNPHGFLKAAALPGANPRATWRWELGEMGRDGPTTVPQKVHIVSITLLGKYRADATINSANMLQRIHTWVPDPVLGDMNYEHEWTNESYVDLGNGVKFPTVWHSHHGWDDNYQAQSVNAGHNGFGGTFKQVTANACPDAVTVPEPVRTATFPVRVETTKLGNGIYLLGGASHNSVAVEFRTFVAVVEAPLNEKRNLAVIDEIVKLIPNKPIRFVVNTHQHHDHIGGLRTYMHVGATIIAHRNNFPFYTRDVLNYAPRTLAPDMVSLWPPTELAEGYYYEQVTENYVLTDGQRLMQMFYVHPLAHVDGMLMAYLPAEKMVIEADLVDTHEPLPSTPTAANRTFYNEVRSLNLDVSHIVPIHGKPIGWDEFMKVIGRENRTN
jgi:glyoxylase-like metal-dependent hydrolase (beta-lactamase superfamily II)